MITRKSSRLRWTHFRCPSSMTLIIDEDLLCIWQYSSHFVIASECVSLWWCFVRRSGFFQLENVKHYLSNWTWNKHSKFQPFCPLSSSTKDIEPLWLEICGECFIPKVLWVVFAKVAGPITWAGLNSRTALSSQSLWRHDHPFDFGPQSSLLLLLLWNWTFDGCYFEY